MPTEPQLSNIKPQKRRSWEAMLIFVILIISLLILFPRSTFVGLFVIFSPFVLLLLFFVKTASKPNSNKVSPLRNFTFIIGIVGAQFVGLFLGIMPLIAISDSSPNSADRNLSFFGLFFTIIFPLIIWAIYYLYKKKNSLKLIIITGIPIILALLILLLLRTV